MKRINRQPLFIKILSEPKLIHDSIKHAVNRIAFDVKGRPVMLSHTTAHRLKDGTFDNPAHFGIEIATMGRMHITSICKHSYAKQKLDYKDFLHNTFGGGSPGFVTSVMKNGNIVREGAYRRLYDLLDRIVDVDGDTLEQLDIIKVTPYKNEQGDNKRIIVHPVTVKPTGAVVLNTYKRNIGKYKPNKGNKKVNPRVTQMLGPARIAVG